MIINKLEMVNFRKYHHKTLEFNNNSVILISTANGLGKTTIIDAIEWCLTGNINRLSTSFLNRSTNISDKKMNNKGILKNRDASKDEEVKVTLWLYNGEKTQVLCRKQKSDELDPNQSVLTLDNDSDLANTFYKNNIGDSFYNYHFCDVQKSFNVQSKKRKELDDIFGEFITNYSTQKQIASTLELFSEDVTRYIEDAHKKLEPQEKIDRIKKQIEEMRNETLLISYPDVIYFPNEITEITALSKNSLIAQKNELIRCAYHTARNTLLSLVKNSELKNQYDILKRLDYSWKTKASLIRSAIDVGFPNNPNILLRLTTKLNSLDELSFSPKTILRDWDLLMSLELKTIPQSDYETDKKAIEEKEEKAKKVQADIELLSSNNKMLELMSSLIANKQTVIDFQSDELKKHGSARCPICGSESFASMEENSILKEAEKYVDFNGEIIKEKEIDKKHLDEEIKSLYLKISNYTKIAVEKEKKTLETELRRLLSLESETRQYFDDVSKLQKLADSIDVEKLSTEKIKELLTTLEKQLLNESQITEAEKEYQRILSVLGYKFENESIQQTFAKLNNLVPDSFEVTNFSYETLVDKLNAIDGVLINQRLLDSTKEYNSYICNNQRINLEIESLNNLKDKADQRVKNIRSTVESLMEEEYESVGPIIGKYYNKLARYNFDNGFRIVRENEGLSLVDNQNKNIVNVLSNGQISVFMLAHFFAGISTRNERENMKVFFIDDLTSCLDDVNILAFMDLLKYQVSSVGSFEQLFFATCSNRISNLLAYKLKGQGIISFPILDEDIIYDD